MIWKAYRIGEWEELGTFHEGRAASFYYAQSFIEEVCGQPMRLQVPENSSLKEKAFLAIGKAQETLKPAAKGMEKKVFRCLADAEEEMRRFQSLPGLKLFECDFIIEKVVKEKWPRGRRSATAKPVLSEEYRIHVTEIMQNKERCKEFLQNESCIVLISNVVEGTSGRDLLRIYKGQQVVENSFRLLKAPSIASVI